MLRHKAHALAAAGQLDAAAEIYAHAAELLPGNDAEAIDLQRLHIEALLRRGRTGEAIPAAAQLLAQIGIRSFLGKKGLGKSRRPKLSAPWFSTKLRTLDFVERPAHACAPEQLLRVDVLYSIVSGLAFADPSLGRALQPELLRAALECGEPVRVCLALAQEVCYAASAGSRNADVVDAVGTRLDELAHRLDQVHVHGLADTALGIAAVMNGRFAQARDRLEAGLAALRDHAAGVRWEIDVGELYWLVALFHLGDWRELMRQSQLVLRDALDRGDVAAQLTIRTGTANLAWLIAGKPDEARAQLASATAALPDGFTLGNALAVIASCNLAIYTGDAAHASRQLAIAWTQLDRIGLLRQQHMRVELIHLRARVSLSDRTRPDDERAALAFADADELAREAVPWAMCGQSETRASARRAPTHLLGPSADAAILGACCAPRRGGNSAGSTMHGWLHIARMRRGLAEGGQGAFARAAAARDALLDAGVADPEQFAALLVPWPT